MVKKLFKRLNITKNQYVLLSIILILGLFLRLYKIANPIADWHSWRQADTASVSRIFKDEGIDLLAPRYYDVSRIQTGAINLKGFRLVEFPIYNLIHSKLAQFVICPQIKAPHAGFARKIYFYFFPTNVDIENIGTVCFEIVGRLISIIFSLITIIVLFLIGRKLYSTKVGVISALLFAILPYNVYFSRTILPESLGVAGGVLGLYLFIKFIDDENKWYLYLSAVFFAVSLLIKPFNIFYLLPALYLSYSKFGKDILKKGNLLIRHLVFVFITLAPFCAWRVWVNKYPAGIPHFEWAFNGDGIRFQPAFWYWIFGERVGKLLLGVWGVIPLYIGLIKTRKNYFAHFWLLGVILYTIVVATANVRHDYYQIMLVPPIVLVVALGLAEAKTKFEKSILIAGMAIALFISAFQVKEFYKINHPELIVAGKAVEKHTPKYAMVIAPYNGDTAFLYQTNRYGWPVVDEQFRDMIKKGARYFVAVNFNDPDVEFVEKNFKVIEKTNQYIFADLLLKP